MKFVFLILCLFLTHPGFSQDVEEENAELFEQQRVQKEKLKAIAEAVTAPKVQVDPAKQLEELSLLDEKLHAQLKKTFTEAKLWEKSREDVKKMLEDGVKGKFAEKVFKQFPKLLEFSTDILRDQKAMPYLIHILTMKQELRQYFFIWLVILVGSWLIKKYLFPPEPNFMRRFFTTLIFSTVTSTISVAVFYMFFKDQLDPSVRIFIQHFL